MLDYRTSIRKQFMVATMATTIVALLVTAITLVVYDYRTFQSAWVSDLDTQAEILVRASAPALEFDDPASAQQYVSYLSARPRILAAAIYTASGELFASYVRPGTTITWPRLPGADGVHLEQGQLTVVKRILGAEGTIGTVYLRARYQLADRVRRYVSVVGVVMLLSLAVAALMSLRMQHALVRPVLEISRVARRVREQRDFALRVTKTSDNEVGYMVESFNDMLAEIERRSTALEQANATLQHEITVRQSAELALRAADQRKDEFLATLAHELRNPLAPLGNALNILRVPGLPAEPAAHAFEMMDRQLHQLVRLVDDLLDVARIATGKVKLRQEPVLLGPIVQNALDTMRLFVQSRKHQIEVRVPPEPIYVYADATRLEQVFVNLLHNAAKFTDPGGRITFEGVRANDELVVTISDTGIGIAAEMLPAIFEMFAQVDRSLERPHAGLGVGLSLAKRLIELHGGSIEAHSAGPGAGAQFRIRLPVMTDAMRGAAGAASIPAGASQGPRRILVADDNEDSANSIAMLLRIQGHEVRVAYDGQQALDEAAAFAPDVAVLDIGLPKMNGYDVARCLRANDPARHLLLVAMTGWGQDEDRRRAQEAGFDHHFVKPVDFKLLLETLATRPTR